MRLEELRGPVEAARVHDHDAGKRFLVTLARVARAWLRLAAISLASRREPRGVPELEFYAEAGAPEGALFADGERIGSLPGVTRL